MVAPPEGHAVFRAVEGHALGACPQWVRCAKSGSEHAEPSLDRSEAACSARGDGISGVWLATKD
jgi:hypothetical protein